jgi:hypothetical protein
MGSCRLTPVSCPPILLLHNANIPTLSNRYNQLALDTGPRKLWHVPPLSSPTRGPRFSGHLPPCCLVGNDKANLEMTRVMVRLDAFLTDVLLGDSPNISALDIW